MSWFKNTAVGQALKMHKTRADAGKIWYNGCQWGGVSPQNTGLDWVAVGGFSDWVETDLNHVSAYRALGRNVHVEQWLGKLSALMGEINLWVTPEMILERWAAIDHEDFWAEAATIVCSDTQWSDVLTVAGGCGNLSPFRVCGREACLAYAQGNGMPHPRVALWLVQENCLTHSDLGKFVWDETFDMRGEFFMDCEAHRPVSPEYVADMCQLMLAHYGLNVEQKIRVMAQAVLAFGYEAWMEHVEAACLPHLQGVDLDLVYAICDVAITDGVDGPPSSLHRTLRCAAQEPGEEYHPDQSISMEWITKEDCAPHEGLMLLMNLTPPKSRLDLYFLARMAQQMERGFIAPSDSLALPDGV